MATTTAITYLTNYSDTPERYRTSIIEDLERALGAHATDDQIDDMFDELHADAIEHALPRELHELNKTTGLRMNDIARHITGDTYYGSFADPDSHIAEITAAFHAAAA